MTRNLRQNVAILVVVMSFFVLSFTTSVESAQTSKKPGKATAPTPAKKSTKPTPAPSKKTSAKATPTPSKKTSAKETAAQKKASAKTPDKKTASKSSTKDSSKDKNLAKNKKTAAKTDKKTDSKKTTIAKSTKPDSKTASKNSKTVTTAKNTAPPKKTTTIKTPVRETTAKTGTKSPVKTIETDSGDGPQIIVTDISARIRSQAKAGSPELSQAKLGTIYRVTEKTPAWYKVLYSSGSKMSTGWISANSVNDMNSAGKDQLYRQITDRYYKVNGMDFATASEVYEFLTRAVNDMGTGNLAEIELKKLVALRSALKAVPPGQSEQNPYRDFLKAHDKEVVYSEPSGEWLVNAGMFWDLHKKYSKSPLADQIAWEGARNPLPGECEGYVNCHLFYARMTSGEYLSLHPQGKNNATALNDLTNLLEPIAASLPDKSVYTGPTDVTDRAEFNNLIAEIRTIVSRLPLAEKEKPLQQLKKIAEGFR